MDENYTVVEEVVVLDNAPTELKDAVCSRKLIWPSHQTELASTFEDPLCGSFASISLGTLAVTGLVIGATPTQVYVRKCLRARASRIVLLR